MVKPLVIAVTAHISVTQLDNRLTDSQARDVTANTAHRILGAWPNAKPRRERPSHDALRLMARNSKTPLAENERLAGRRYRKRQDTTQTCVARGRDTPRILSHPKAMSAPDA